MNFESAYGDALFSVIRLRTKSDSGQVMHGTGFVYEFVTEDNTFPFLVSAKALVESASEGRLALIQAEGKQARLGKGYTLDIEQFSKLWYSHPDSDLGVSITPFVPFVRHIENTGIRIHFNAFLEKDRIGDDFLKTADFGQQCSMIGFPAAYWDRKNLLPVIRSSNLASMPNLDFGVRQQLLLDSPCYAGWLGAPVMCHVDDQLKLLGMICNSNQRLKQDDEDLVEDVSMSLMLKSDAIVETISAYLKEKGFI